ncbi:hypothetical protein BD769DRAFT_1637411 [Suillus cothurnatus]|nr:hypothetical protein BD769DRAFT_1637411 [Suillus cothurnatus]
MDDDSAEIELWMTVGKTPKTNSVEVNEKVLIQHFIYERWLEGGSEGEVYTFYDLLEEVGERHWLAKVLEEDSEERNAVGEEVVKLAAPSLQQFMQKQKEKEFSKNIKLSPEEVKSRIMNFYN